MGSEQISENQLLKYLSLRFGVHCEDCGRHDNLTVHHLLPRRSKGTNDADNLEILCIGCHRKREGTDKPKSAYR